LDKLKLLELMVHGSADSALVASPSDGCCTSGTHQVADLDAEASVPAEQAEAAHRDQGLSRLTKNKDIAVASQRLWAGGS